MLGNLGDVGEEEGIVLRISRLLVEEGMGMEEGLGVEEGMGMEKGLAMEGELEVKKGLVVEEGKGDPRMEEGVGNTVYGIMV